MLLELELSLKTLILTSEAVFLDFGVFGLLDELVVEAVPFVVRVDEGIVVPALRSTRVDDCTSEPVLVSLVLDFFTFFTCFSSTQVLSCIWLHVEFNWELQVTVDLYLMHLVVVEFKPLDGDRQDIGQFLDAESFLCTNLLLTDLTEIGIIAIEYLPFNKPFKRLLKRLLPPDIDSD